MPIECRASEEAALGLSESDTRAKLIDPAIHERGWTEDLIRREETAGAIEIIDGRPFKQARGRIDYTLRVKVLYDGREVIYVGRTTDRPLGTRLFEHTVDRMSARWDRFSWFGLLPVSAAGTLRAMPASFDSAKLAPALEAILVEALEPRQNRKRGDDLAAVEYVQVEDPEIQKRRAKALIDRL